MWTPLILIILTTLASIISLWRDQFISEKIIKNPEETDEERIERKEAKTRNIKIVSTILISLTLLFTIYQILTSNKQTRTANAEKINQHIFDSTRYAEDSVKHIYERKQDSTSRVLIDSIHKIQIEAYKIQILAGQSIDNIKSKTASIIKNLVSADTALQISTTNINSIKLSVPPINNIIFQKIDDLFKNINSLDNAPSEKFSAFDIPTCFRGNNDNK